MEPWIALQQIALSLTESLHAGDRYDRLLQAVRAAIPCDATALLALNEGVLVPLAVHGLSPQVLGMRFAPSAHPRLAQIVRSTQPVRFPADSQLPDPFDGLVTRAPNGLSDVHDCLGCPLVADGRVVGVLTADALADDAFDGLNQDLLVALGALAGATLHTARLIETIETLAERRGLVVRELTRASVDPAASQMLGVSSAMELVRREIDAVAKTEFAVLILGETGVGKELAARAIHDGSPRREAPFIQVNCAALPEGVIESELFGHVRGAFTGAIANRPGKFELADGGTLFLDEIGELPLAVQSKLLRVLQEGEVQRVGADKPLRVDVRIVAATNRNLTDEISHGRFRPDLYHRLAVFPLAIPPLRDRHGDVPVLAGFFLDRYRVQLGLSRVLLSDAAHALLDTGTWPGNVRELDHVLARAVLRASMRAGRGAPVQIEQTDLDPSIAQVSEPEPGPSPLARKVAHGELSLRVAVDELKRTAIVQTLEASGGNWAETARRLGMDRSNLHHLAKRLGVAQDPS